MRQSTDNFHRPANLAMSAHATRLRQSVSKQVYRLLGMQSRSSFSLRKHQKTENRRLQYEKQMQSDGRYCLLFRKQNEQDDVDSCLARNQVYVIGQEGAVFGSDP